MLWTLGLIFIILAGVSAMIAVVVLKWPVFVVWLLSLLILGYLAAFLKFYVNNGRNDRAVNAFSILCLNIVIFVLLGGATLNVLGEWMPYAAFILLGVLFLASELTFTLYFKRMLNADQVQRLSRTFGFNFLKGFGGDTFAEFASGVGVLVSVGIYLVYGNASGGFWWAAQLAALISVMSAASWVPRYVLEEPNFLAGVQNPTARDYMRKAGQNFWNNLAALWTVIAILLPTEENVSGLNAAAGEGWKWVIYAGWSLMLIAWAVSAILPLSDLRASLNWPRNPASSGSNASWTNRDKVSGFLIWVVIFTVSALIFILVSLGFIGGESTWPQWMSLGAGILSALFVFVGIGWKWIFDKYALEDAELRMLLIFKDIGLFVTGFLIFLGQIVVLLQEHFLEISPWRELYLMILGFMAYSFLIGILLGAYKWSKKQEAWGLSQPVPASP